EGGAEHGGLIAAPAVAEGAGRDVIATGPAHVDAAERARANPLDVHVDLGAERLRLERGGDLDATGQVAEGNVLLGAAPAVAGEDEDRQYGHRRRCGGAGEAESEAQP